MGSFKGMWQSISCCHRDGVFYTGQVRLSWNFLRLTLLAALPWAGAGCSGLNSSQSVSPLDFLLPGAGHIIKAAPPATNAPVLFPEFITEVVAVN